MTEKEIKAEFEKAKTAGWDYPGVVIEPGRWIDRMCLIELPEDCAPPFGGDVMACIWRYENNPEMWVMTWRVRFNAGRNSDPWVKAKNGGDRKSWQVTRGQGEPARKAMVESLSMIPLRMSADFKTEIPGIDWLVIQGDCDKFFEVCQREKKPWMHMKGPIKRR